MWKNRNEKKHGGTSEEREANHQKKLFPRIAQAYKDQYAGLVPGARRSLFRLSKATRLGFRAVTNERWLEMVTVTREANEERERKLLNRIPKLQTYYKVTRKGKTISQEEPPERSELPQHLMSEYITISDGTPSITGEQRLETIRETTELDPPGVKAPRKIQKEQTYMTEFFRHSSGVEEELWSLHEVEGRNIDTMSALEK